MTDKKTNSAPRRRSTTKKTPDGWIWRNVLWLMTAILAVIVALGAVVAFAYIPCSPNKDKEWVCISRSADKDEVKNSLKSSLGSATGMRVYIIWSLMGGTPEGSVGAYRMDRGQTALSIARRIAAGRQTPVRLTFKGPRKLEVLAERIAHQLELTPEEFLEACNRVLPKSGFTPATFPAAFLPDTYEVYWASSADDVVSRLLDYRNRFWTPERVAKAKALGLSKVEVAIVASIIEEETAKTDERPLVARLYLNRLKKGMLLQADPTVKFAVGDFSLRRITGVHLRCESPYNTYRHKGLPPGPIRVVEGASIDAVLNAPQHSYLYMCAREDFSGYHNFATDYATHLANARRYQAELDRRNITK
ncbi:MAG: endolytic transglycosylase MltG [Duncaniella sp.]|nr:endolytic transglycosylase MltG [Duncaniella sp.]